MSNMQAGGVEGVLILNADQYFNGLKQAEAKTKTFAASLETAGNKMQATGKSWARNVTLPLVAIAGYAVKVGLDFESAMSEVQALSGATGDDLVKLTDRAREMGATTKYSATDAANALTFMGQAGWSTEQMLSGIDGVMMLAAASGEDLAATASIVTDSLTGFGYAASDAGHFADVLAKAAAASNTDVAMMGETFKYVAPLAGVLKYSVEDVAIATGLMANAGIKGGQAGTALRAALSRLLKPTKMNRDAIEELGISMTDASGNTLPLRDLMVDLREKFAGLTDAEKAQYAATIFGQEAMSGMLAIINSSDEDFNKLTSQIDNSSGAAKEMSDIMNNNLKGSWQEFQSLVEEVGLQLYDVLLPVLKDLLDKFSGIVQAFKDMSPEQKEQIMKWAGIAAAIGPVLIVTGKFATALGSIASLAKIATPVIAGLGPGVAGVGTAAGTAAGSAGLGGFITSLGSVALAAAPYVIAAAVIGAAGYAVYQGLTAEVIPAVDLFAEHVQFTSTEVTDAYGNVSTVVTETTVVISEETAKQVGEFMTLAEEAQLQTHNMYLGVGGETQTGMTTVLGIVTTMSDQIVAASELQKNETIAEYTELFNNTTVLTDKEMIDILATVEEGHLDRVEKTKKLKEDLIGIYDEIRRSGVDMTKKQKEDIDAILNELKILSVQTMSENEAEQNVILNRLANSNTRITAKMVGDTIKELNVQKNETVRIAGETRDETVRQAEELRTLEGGKYSAKADEIIAEANRQYDGVVDAAEKTKTQGIDKLSGAYGNLVDDIDTNTGEILTLWGKVKQWWNSWNPAPKNTTVTTNQVTVYSNRTASDTSNPYGASRNAHGTNSFGGGLTWVGEQGRELIELPQGTKIHSNNKSENMIGSQNGGSLTLNIPVVVSGREIAKASVKYTAEELTNLMNTPGGL